MPLGFPVPGGPAPYFVATNPLVNQLFDPLCRRAGTQLVQRAASLGEVGAASIAALTGDALAVGAPPVSQDYQPIAPADKAWFLYASERQQLVDTWWAMWNGAPPAPGWPAHLASDVNLLQALRDYILDPTNAGGGGAPIPANRYVLWVPEVAYDGMRFDAPSSSNRLALVLRGYQAVDLWNPAGPGAWDQANTYRFLNLLGAGAHVVVVTAQRDLAAAGGARPDFYGYFTNQLGAQSRAALAHSHYSGAGGGTNLGAAWTYPGAITTETTPAPCPTICAFLVGRTAYSLLGNEFNTFFQLEGWPATVGGELWSHLPGGQPTRHAADFAAHNASLWNFSTFGASLYSEKRGTTVFLAPAGWNPQAGGPTIMAPYVGAETPQRWLVKNLIRA